MVCQKTVEGQSEFGFFQQITSEPNVLVCGGPLTFIAFTRYSLDIFVEALDELKVAEDHLDFFAHQVIDSEHMAIEMCARHWLQHSTTVGTLAIAAKNESWSKLAYHILRIMCKANNWDYKEIINYGSTVSKIRAVNNEED